MGASILLAIFSKSWSGFNFGRLNDAGVRELVELGSDCVVIISRLPIRNLKMKNALFQMPEAEDE
jgi:hypothetical protein